MNVSTRHENCHSLRRITSVADMNVVSWVCGLHNCFSEQFAFGSFHMSDPVHSDSCWSDVDPFIPMCAVFLFSFGGFHSL